MLIRSVMAFNRSRINIHFTSEEHSFLPVWFERCVFDCIESPFLRNRVKVFDRKLIDISVRNKNRYHGLLEVRATLTRRNAVVWLRWPRGVDMYDI